MSPCTERRCRLCFFLNKKETVIFMKFEKTIGNWLHFVYNNIEYAI